MGSKVLTTVLIGLVLLMGALLFTQPENLQMQDSTVGLFQAWMRQYGKNYTNATFMYKLQVFTENVRYIESINRQNLSYTLGINQFTDLTQQEFIDTYLSTFPFNPSYNASNVNTTYTIPNAAIDWVAKGAVGPVKNQGQCGSCWAFSTTGVLEGAYQIQKGSLLSFSESQLVDCSRPQGNQGCNGGWPSWALNYVQANGIQLESAYPYVARDNSCKIQGGPYKIRSHTGTQGCDKLTSDLTTQPTSVCVDASNWSAYRSGVFSNCGTSINHAVLATGIDANGNWVVKNSWGTGWGASGYITLAQGNTCAVCNVLENVQF